MEGTMEKTNKMLAFLHPIIEEADPELEDFLIRYGSWESDPLGFACLYTGQ